MLVEDLQLSQGVGFCSSVHENSHVCYMYLGKDLILRNLSKITTAFGALCPTVGLKSNDWRMSLSLLPCLLFRHISLPQSAVVYTQLMLGLNFFTAR